MYTFTTNSTSLQREITLRQREYAIKYAIKHPNTTFKNTIKSNKSLAFIS
jgi:hypothetical protein